MSTHHVKLNNMKNVHHEFSYQSRELGVQIEDTLGEPPDRKSYAKVIKSLIGEFASGTEFDDVNLLSFALADYLSFDDPAGLLAQCAYYDKGDALKVVGMVSCVDEDASKALTAVCNNNPELARKAIITIFLYKNPKRWVQEDNSLEALQQEENGVKEDEEEHLAQDHDIAQLFDAHDD